MGVVCVLAIVFFNLNWHLNDIYGLIVTHGTPPKRYCFGVDLLSKWVQLIIYFRKILMGI